MKSNFFKVFCLLFTVILSLSLAGCSEKTGTTDSKNEEKVIKLGTLSLNETFVSLLKDELVKKGYKAEIIMFDANNMAAIAAKDGDIDGFIHNHLPWIETFNKENNSNLKMVEPYLFYYRFAMYSSKHENIEAFPDKAQIAIANDPANVEKSLLFLQDLGLLTLDKKTENFYTILDIKENPKNIKLLETEISTTARSINDADAVICPSSRIRAAGFDANLFLAEDLTAVNLPVGLTVNENNLNEQWVSDAMTILSTDEMKAKFNEIYDGTQVLYE